MLHSLTQLHKPSFSLVHFVTAFLKAYFYRRIKKRIKKNIYSQNKHSGHRAHIELNGFFLSVYMCEKDGSNSKYIFPKRQNSEDFFQRNLSPPPKSIIIQAEKHSHWR